GCGGAAPARTRSRSPPRWSRRSSCAGSTRSTRYSRRRSSRPPAARLRSRSACERGADEPRDLADRGRCEARADRERERLRAAALRLGEGARRRAPRAERRLRRRGERVVVAALDARALQRIAHPRRRGTAQRELAPDRLLVRACAGQVEALAAGELLLVDPGVARPPLQRRLQERQQRAQRGRLERVEARRRADEAVRAVRARALAPEPARAPRPASGRGGAARSGLRGAMPPAPRPAPRPFGG